MCDWKTDAEAVQSLGEELGWGHLMELSAALWAIDFQEEGYPTDGCFVPVLLNQIGDDDQREDTYYEREMYIREILAARDKT